MVTKVQNPPTTNQQIVFGSVEQVIGAFLVDRKVRNLSPRTIEFYGDELRYFSTFLDLQGVNMIEEITSDVIRTYLLDKGQTRNPGGVFTCFRAIRTLMKWYWSEFEIERRNPIERVKPPRVVNNPLPGILLSDVSKMIEACNGPTEQRDKAILYMLIDTGMRAAELCALNVVDVNLLTGAVVILAGKGGKRRVVYLGRKSKRMVRRYLQSRRDNNPALWITEIGDRLSFYGLQSMTRRLAKLARVKRPGLHDFRRAAAVAWLRGGMSIIEVSRLLGHSSLVVTQRYLYLVDADLAEAHRKVAPGDFL